MLIRNQTPSSCFGLAGTDENAGTAALGWCLDLCQSLRRELMLAFDLDPSWELALSSQVFGKNDRGFTDLEITAGTALHIIFEAKRGWQVPTHAQLSRYTHRLLESVAHKKRLVSISAADRAWALTRLPHDVQGVSVDHISWSDIQSMARRAHDAAKSPVERLWLRQLSMHLAEYGMTSNAFDSMTYVVSLSRDIMPSSDSMTWIDVVAKQGKYFHPIGGNGWPTIPPAYIGFRYLSEFRSAHFIESVQTTDHLHQIDPNWPETNTPHFVYTLGPPMRPASPLGLGSIYYTARHWVALDLLLSGKTCTYQEAIDLTKERQAQRGA